MKLYPDYNVDVEADTKGLKVHIKVWCKHPCGPNINITDTIPIEDVTSRAIDKAIRTGYALARALVIKKANEIKKNCKEQHNH